MAWNLLSLLCWPLTIGINLRNRLVLVCNRYLVEKSTFFNRIEDSRCQQLVLQWLLVD